MLPVPATVWFPAVMVLAGALIGSLAPMVVSMITARAEHRRERMRLAVQLAVEDVRVAAEIAKTSTRRRVIYPLSTYVAFHADVLALVAKGKSITPEDYDAVSEASRALVAAVDRQALADQDLAKK